MKIKTTKLNDLINKALKGSSNNKLIPITSMMGITVDKGMLTLATTNNSHVLEVSCEVDGKEKLNVTVLIDRLSKLVAKTTSEYFEIALDKKEKVLNITGNGKYIIELPLDEEGDLINFPLESFPQDAKPLKDGKKKMATGTQLSTLPKMNQSSIVEGSTNMPILANYVMGKGVVLTTDSIVLTETKMNTFKDVVLVPTPIVSMFELLNGEEVELYIVQEDGRNKLQVRSKNIKITGWLIDDVKNYPLPALETVKSQEYAGAVEVTRSYLMDVLDRITLFASDFEIPKINLLFSKDEGLAITDTKSNNIETLEYKSSNLEEDYECSLNATKLRNIIASHTHETIELFVGSDKGIKVVGENSENILGLTAN